MATALSGSKQRIFYLSINGFPRSAHDNRGRFSLEHAHALQQCSIDVRCFDLSSSESSSNKVEGLTIYRFFDYRLAIKRLKPFRALANFSRFYSLLRQQKPNRLILSFLSPYFIPYIAIASFAGTKYGLIVHGADAMQTSWLSNLLRRIVLHFSHSVFTVSEYTDTILRTRYANQINYQKKIHFIQNGVSVRKLGTRPEHIRNLQACDIPQILTVANLIQRKGVEILVSSLLRLSDQGVKYHHVVVGTGPQQEKIKQLISRSPYSNNFTLIDAVSDVELVELYKRSHIFALASRTDWQSAQCEGFGMCFPEAQYFGLALVGTSLCGISQTVTHMNNGLLVNPSLENFADRVSDALHRILSDREFLNKLRQSSITSRVPTWQDNAILMHSILL